VMANREVERIFRYPRGELIGELIEVLIPVHLRVGHRGFRESFLENPVARVMGLGRELHGCRKDGGLVPVEIGLTPSPTAEGMYVIAAVADVSTRRRLEDDLRQSQRMSALGEVTGAVAHDFNNLLTTILTSLDLGLDQCREALEGDHPAFGELAVARASAERAVSLTRQLLAFSKRRVFCPVPISLNQLVENSRPMLERLIGACTTLRMDLREDLPPVSIDPDLFGQVLLNLTVNAADAIDGRGTIWIRTEIEEGGGDLAERVRLEVTDTGGAWIQIRLLAHLNHSSRPSHMAPASVYRRFTESSVRQAG